MQANETRGEAGTGFRQSLQPPIGASPFPVCFVGASDLQEALRRSEQKDLVTEVLEKDRSDCPEWTPYKAGFSPREHRLMLDQQQEREQEAQRWRWSAIRLVILLIFVTLAAPTLAVVIERFLLNGG